MLLSRWIIAILTLPVTALILAPMAILWLSCGTGWSDSIASLSTPVFWLAVFFGLFGMFSAIWAVSLFFRFGNGTAAPWDPPRRFVVRGPYCYMRNPMITGALLVLSAETLLFQSWPIFIWLVIFAVGNVIYIPTIEEKGLEKRFGRDYLIYKRHVPRWIPRLTAWQGLQKED